MDAPEQNRQTKELSKTRFGEWFDKTQGLIEDLHQGKEPTPIVLQLQPETIYNQNEWPEPHNKLEVAKNVAYHSTTKLFESILDQNREDTLIELIQNYSKHLSHFTDLGIGDNRISAYVMRAGVEAEKRLLIEIKEHGDLHNLSQKAATYLHARYLEIIAEMIENAITQDQNKNAEEKTFYLPPQITPFLLEAAYSSSEKSVSDLLTYTDYSKKDGEVSTRVELAKKKLEELRKVLQNNGTNSTPIVHDNGWIFYASASNWPKEQVDRCVTSHAPDFGSYPHFTGRMEPNDYNGGVFLTGTPIKYFANDFGAREEDLAQGEKWEWNLFLEIQRAQTDNRRNGIAVSNHEVSEELEAIWEKVKASSLQEAWDKRQHEYTEVWLDRADVYAIWLSPAWEQNLNYFYKPTREKRCNNLLQLINARPELPLVTMNGHVLDRDSIIQEIDNIKKS